VKVLVVDDEELDLFICQKLLSLEFQTAGFNSSEDVLAWARQNDFDVAVIDYYLGPGILAGNVLNELIAIKGPSFKAFVLTNYVDEKQTADLIKSGFADIITKPLTLEVFRKKVGSLIP
jgi:DNA-binding NtrC family response regulator